MTKSGVKAASARAQSRHLVGLREGAPWARANGYRSNPPIVASEPRKVLAPFGSAKIRSLAAILLSALFPAISAQVQPIKNHE
jgi:hypothetical protein